MPSKTIKIPITPLNLNKAENYLLCGALSKTMQIISDQNLDYWFFSGLTGDTFTQVFSRNFNKYYDCLSSAIFGKQHLDNIFSAIGYGYKLVSNAEFYQAPEIQLSQIKAYIDKDLPVIVKDTADSWYSLAVGYENDTILKFDMLSDKLQTYNFNLSQNSNYALIFIENKLHDINLAQTYKNAVLAVPSLLNKSPTSESSFGKQAFTDWADSLLAGRSEFINDYFDWAGTNAHMDIFLNRALALNPSLKPLTDKLISFAQMNAALFPLASLAQNPANHKEIATKINQLALYCDEIFPSNP